MALGMPHDPSGSRHKQRAVEPRNRRGMGDKPVTTTVDQAGRHIYRSYAFAPRRRAGRHRGHGQERAGVARPAGRTSRRQQHHPKTDTEDAALGQIGEAEKVNPEVCIDNHCANIVNLVNDVNLL